MKGMVWKEHKAAILSGLFLVVFFASFSAWLAWRGYLFPIRYVEYYPQGTVRVEGYRLRISSGDTGDDWMKEGKWTKYYPDGTKAWEGNYHRSGEVGTWTYWSADGAVERIDEYDWPNGAVRTTPYENGVPVPESRRPQGRPRSGIHWHDDRAKREEIEDAFQRKLREGIPVDEAAEAIMQEFHLREPKPEPNKPSAPPKAESRR
jgi:hypothetical protein